MLQAELIDLADAATHPSAARWRDALRPLAEHIVGRFLDYLPKATYPVRAGTHVNSAFALILAMRYGQRSSTRRLLAFFGYLACFHLHLVLDYFGSGPGWPIHYFWPFSDAKWGNADAWPLSSWQNTTAAALLLVWTVWIAVRHGRTPLELLMPSLDEKAIAWIDRRRGATRDGAVMAE
jgi:hypothetical protein